MKLYINKPPSTKTISHLRNLHGALTTPFKIKIKSCRHTVGKIQGSGYACNQFSPDKMVYMPNIIGGDQWYKDKIGEDFEVLLFNQTHYRVNNPAGCGFYFIHKKDCTLL